MEAIGVVRWCGLLAEALDVLETGEDELVAVLGTEPGELDDRPWSWPTRSTQQSPCATGAPLS